MVSNVLIWCPLGPEGFRLYQGPPYIGVGQNPFYSKVPDWEISGHHLLLVPKIVAYFRCLFFIMSVHSHICTYSTYILNTYIHNDLWQCICVLMICFLAKKIITLYPVRVRISLKKRRLRFFFWNLPFGQVSFFFFRNLPPPRLRFFWPISLEVSFFERGFVFNIQPNTYA